MKSDKRREAAIETGEPSIDGAGVGIGVAGRGGVVASTGARRVVNEPTIKP